MNFKIRGIRAVPEETEQSLKVARKFTDEILKELKGFVKCIVFFGSGARGLKSRKLGDIDLLVIFDDLPENYNPDIIKSYILITSKIAKKVSPNIHITHMPLTEFWNYTRNGDPIAMNIIREGIPTFDPGFFQPVKALLRRGYVKPSNESIILYSLRSPASIESSDWRILQATIDLYWAVIDSAHAALMKKGHVPVSPDHVSDLLDKEFVQQGNLDKSYSLTMANFFKLQQLINQRKIRQISGQEYERYYQQAQSFIASMRKIIEA